MVAEVRSVPRVVFVVSLQSVEAIRCKTAPQRGLQEGLMRALTLCFVMCSFLVVSCVSGGDGGGGGSAVCSRASSKLRGCNLLGMGTWSECEEPVGAGERCQANCLLNASCADLSAALCDDSFSASLEACVNACPDDEFTCDNGETVPMSWQCDGENDCSDGSDEVGCQSTVQTFACGDGDTIPLDWQCDDEQDCTDGSDEVGCPEEAQLICN